MLDKLALTSDEAITLEEATNNLKGSFTHYKPSGSKYYQGVYSFHRGRGGESSHLLTLHIYPRYSNIAASTLVINPSRFRSLTDMERLISRITDCSKLVISRIDHAVDINVDIRDIYNSLIYSRKKAREQFKGPDLTGFYLGEWPEQLAVYDKARKEKLPETLTRIELRHSGSKIVFRKFKDLPCYQSFSPFLSLKFMKVVNSSPQSPRALKRNFLLAMIEKGGAQGTYKALNRHANFKRDFGDYFEVHPNIPDLNQIYQNNLSKFFGGGEVQWLPKSKLKLTEKML